MFNPNYVAFAIISVVVFTLYMSVLHLIFYSSKLRNRVRSSGLASYAGDTAEEAAPLFARLCDAVLARLAINVSEQKELAVWLSRAGLESPYAVSYYLFFSRIAQPLLLLAGIVFAFGMMKGGGALDVLFYLLTLGIFVIAGLRGAKLYVENLRQKRMARLVDSFPETLDLLLVCIESGLGLDAALNRVCKELRHVHPTVVSELDRMRLELTMLNDRTQALHNLAERVGLVSFKTLVAALIQTEKFGTSLVDTLRVLSEEQRLARLYAAEQKAARIPVLITIPLIVFIMPAFIMIIVAPPIVKVINQGGLFGGSVIGKQR
jgi:tight adherence protein C